MKLTCNQAFDQGKAGYEMGTSRDNPPSEWTELQQELWVEGWDKAEQQSQDLIL